MAAWQRLHPMSHLTAPHDCLKSYLITSQSSMEDPRCRSVCPRETWCSSEEPDDSGPWGFISFFSYYVLAISVSLRVWNHFLFLQRAGNLLGHFGCVRCPLQAIPLLGCLYLCSSHSPELLLARSLGSLASPVTQLVSLSRLLFCFFHHSVVFRAAMWPFTFVSLKPILAPWKDCQPVISQ